MSRKRFAIFPATLGNFERGGIAFKGNRDIGEVDVSPGCILSRGAPRGNFQEVPVTFVFRRYIDDKEWGRKVAVLVAMGGRGKGEGKGDGRGRGVVALLEREEREVGGGRRVFAAFGTPPAWKYFRGFSEFIKAIQSASASETALWIQFSLIHPFADV